MKTVGPNDLTTPRSGLAWDRCSCRNSDGSILELAVIAVPSFEWVVGDLSKNHAVTAQTSTPGPSPRRTPLCWTQLKVTGQRVTLSMNRGPDTVGHFVLRMSNASSHYKYVPAGTSGAFSGARGVAAASIQVAWRSTSPSSRNPGRTGVNQPHSRWRRPSNCCLIGIPHTKPPGISHVARAYVTGGSATGTAPLQGTRPSHHARGHR